MCTEIRPVLSLYIIHSQSIVKKRKNKSTNGLVGPLKQSEYLEKKSTFFSGRVEVFFFFSFHSSAQCVEIPADKAAKTYTETIGKGKKKNQNDALAAHEYIRVYA